MLDEIPHKHNLASSIYEEETRPRKKRLGLSASLACYGGGKSSSKQSSSSTTETNTTSNVEDNRQGVSEEGILAEEGSSVSVDRSSTTIIEDNSEEIAVAAIESNEGVSTVAIEEVSNVAESALDTSERLFNEATGFATDVVQSNEEVTKFSIRETQDSLRLAAQQQGDLAAKFLNEGKNLIQDSNRETGERLGNTAIIGAFVLGGGFLALQFFKK